MRENISFDVCSADGKRHLAIAADRNTPAEVVWRAKIILATANGLGTMAMMRKTGKSKPCVWRWHERVMHEGVDGLLHDKTRPPGTPSGATQWSVRTMAKATGISRTSVQRIWK